MDISDTYFHLVCLLTNNLLVQANLFKAKHSTSAGAFFFTLKAKTECERIGKLIFRKQTLVISLLLKQKVKLENTPWYALALLMCKCFWPTNDYSLKIPKRILTAHQCIHSLTFGHRKFVFCWHHYNIR
jgi:hypothetical protein